MVTTVNADHVLAGLYAWLGANQWFTADRVEDADLTAEAAAQQALLMLAAGHADDYRTLPLGVRALAVRLTIDFLAKLMGPMARRSWQLAQPPADAQQAAWRIVEQEIARSSGPAARPH